MTHRLKPLPGRLSTQGIDRAHCRISTLIPLLGHEGIPKNHLHWAQSNNASELDTTLQPKTLMHWIYGSCHL